MHIFQFLSNLPGAIYVKVVKPRLPKSRQPRVALLKCQAHLFCCHAAFPFSQIARNALLQHFQHQRRRTLCRFADQQVHMLGHHHIPNQAKPIALSNFCQRRNECIPGPRRSQKRQPPVAAKRQKMKMALSVVALKRIMHRLGRMPTEEKPAPLDPKGAAPLCHPRLIAEVVCSLGARTSRKNRSPLCSTRQAT